MKRRRRRQAQEKLASPTDIISLEEGRASKFSWPGQHVSSLPSCVSIKLLKRIGLRCCLLARRENRRVKQLFFCGRLLNAASSVSSVRLRFTSASSFHPGRIIDGRKMACGVRHNRSESQKMFIYRVQFCTNFVSSSISGRCNCILCGKINH